MEWYSDLAAGQKTRQDRAFGRQSGGKRKEMSRQTHRPCEDMSRRQIAVLDQLGGCGWMVEVGVVVFCTFQSKRRLTGPETASPTSASPHRPRRSALPAPIRGRVGAWSAVLTIAQTSLTARRPCWSLSPPPPSVSTHHHTPSGKHLFLRPWSPTARPNILSPCRTS